MLRHECICSSRYTWAVIFFRYLQSRTLNAKSRCLSMRNGDVRTPLFQPFQLKVKRGLVIALILRKRGRAGNEYGPFSHNLIGHISLDIFISLDLLFCWTCFISRLLQPKGGLHISCLMCFP